MLVHITMSLIALSIMCVEDKLQKVMSVRLLLFHICI